MVVLTEITEIAEHSSTSSGSSTCDYDVFLSFRGEDTRYNFTDHLLKALQEATIDTFFDDTEIQIGDFLKPELESAIKSSRASVIVLSKNYASSTWCLDELALIMEQRKTSNHIVFPVFYHVNPSDVRKQRNSFGDAMAVHRRRMEAESDAEKKSQWAQKMKQWKEALTEVADMKGVEANGRETILIEEIVKKISSRLDLHKRSEIPKIIGMGYSLREITSFLEDGSRQSTKILTIWGMAGIGKTYLANYIFKLLYHNFESSCFLEDIGRRWMRPNELLDLQKQLLKDIGVRSWMDVNDVSKGTLKIEKSLSRKRTLLVLDGINKLDQLDVLLGTKGLHPGSKIIITSENGSLTEKCRLFETQVPPNHTKHLLEGLCHEESLQLLSWHAFGRNKPNEGDKKQLMKILEYCKGPSRKGHPLALKVLGSSLRSEDTTMEDILESLGKEVNPDITNVLKYSFDTLPSEKDKELFKYIACLFVGEDRKFSEEILKACGICKSSGIKILINRCLLTVDLLSNKLKMHQLLQDMGRDIVRQESILMPWNRSILWHHEECLDVLQNKQGTSIIQGLALDMRISENEISKESISVSMLSDIWWLFDWVSRICSSSHGTKGDFETLALSEMRELKLLKLNYVQLKGSYKNFPQGLRWLCMHGFPLSYIPLDLQMENMVALDMSNSKLQQLWKKPKHLRSLKFLNLSSCHKLVRVGHFYGFPLLERLILARCTSLVEVCESIGAYCQKLEFLDLSECSKLKGLPTSIGDLKNLTELLLDGCSNISHVSSFFTMVPRISNSLLSFLPSSLVKLSVTFCNLYTTSFPKDFSSIPMLKELYLDGNPIESMPDCVSSLSRLETLSFVFCFRLKTILCAPIQLKYLDLHRCHSLEKITFHPKMSHLPKFDYDDCFSLTEIEGKFITQDLSEIDEEVLKSLGWINIEYLNHISLLKDDTDEAYRYRLPKRTLPILPVPAQLLYEHGIFSTYLQGEEVPNWFSQRSKGPLFTLEASPEKGVIRGINVCIVRTVSSKMYPFINHSINRFTPFRITIKNLTKNISWTYQPAMYLLLEDDKFENGDKVVVWLSHWMFGGNEFEDGDKVNIYFSELNHLLAPGRDIKFVGRRGYENVKVKEYGISPVYDDDDNGRNQKEDPLAYYKSWKHIIGGDLSGFEVSSNQYLLKLWTDSNLRTMEEMNGWITRVLPLYIKPGDSLLKQAIELGPPTIRPPNLRPDKFTLILTV